MPYACDKHSVKNIITQFVAAWNKADAKLLEALLEEDATVVDEQGERFTGQSKAAKTLATLAQGKPMRVAAVQFKAFHPDIVMSEVSCVLADESAKALFDLVATCGPDEWQIEWVRFLPRTFDE